MHRRILFNANLWSLAFLALLAGCSGSGSASPGGPLPTQGALQSVSRSAQSITAHGRQWISLLPDGVARENDPDLSRGFADVDAASKGAVLVSDVKTNDVYIFTTTGTLTATITGFLEPEGLALDTSGNVYVGNTYGNNVPVYEKDYRTLKMTLNDPGQFPGDPAVDDSSGIVAVTNILATSGAPGSVSFYARGATSPCTTVSGDSAWNEVYYAAFDSTGNLYVDGKTSSGTFLVGIVKGGCSAKKIATLGVKTIMYPGGIQVTPQGKIAICDQHLADVFTFNPPVNGSLGSPIATTPLTGTTHPTTIAFAKSAADVWTVDLTDAEAFEFSYPAGGKAKEMFGQPTPIVEPLGVAVTPLALP